MRIFYFLSFLLLFTISSCDNELKVTADWKDTTVVFGLLDPLSDENYIRIERGYLGSEAASNSFSEPDSFFYSSLNVEMNWYDENDNIQGTVSLLEDRTKVLNDNGPFDVGQDYRLYKIPNGTPIDPAFEYELRIIKPNEEVTTARTRILNPDRIVINGSSLNSPNSNSPTLRSSTLNFRNSDGSERSSVAIFQVYMNFYWKEIDQITGAVSLDSIRFKYGEQRARSEYVIGPSGGTDAMFALIANRISQKENVLREFLKIKFEVWASDENLLVYSDLKTPSTGINQNRPNPADALGLVENGIGILASRYNKEYDNVQFNSSGNPVSLKDNLLINPNMCPLRFVRYQGTDTCICKDIGSTLTVECL